MEWETKEPIPILDFRDLETMITTGQNFTNIALDDAVHIAVTKSLLGNRRKAAPASSPDSDEDDEAPRSAKKKKPQGGTVTNPNVKLINQVEGSKFREVYQSNSATMPKLDNKNACMNYHLLGKCKFGVNCKRHKSHKKLKSGYSDSMDAWALECRTEPACLDRTAHRRAARGMTNRPGMR